MDARDVIVQDVRRWRELLTHEIEGMSGEEILRHLHRKSDEIKMSSGLSLASVSASDAASARRQSTLGTSG